MSLDINLRKKMKHGFGRLGPWFERKEKQTMFWRCPSPLTLNPRGCRGPWVLALAPFCLLQFLGLFCLFCFSPYSSSFPLCTSLFASHWCVPPFFSSFPPLLLHILVCVAASLFSHTCGHTCAPLIHTTKQYLHNSFVACIGLHIVCDSQLSSFLHRVGRSC